MKPETRELIFDIATGIEVVSGRLQDISTLVGMIHTEQSEEHPNKNAIETLTNVVIDMLDYQNSELQNWAVKTYGIYYGKKGDPNE